MVLINIKNYSHGIEYLFLQYKLCENKLVSYGFFTALVPLQDKHSGHS